MRVFVAGATGAVGRPLVRQLLDAGHEVTGMTRSDERAQALREQGAEAVVADVYDAARVREVVAAARPEALVHQLTDLKTLTPKNLEPAYAALSRIRTEGTRVLMEAAREAGVRRVVAQSIAFVYAPEGGSVKDEDAPIWEEAPEPFRGALAATMNLERQVTEAEPIEGVALRYGFFYGPGTSYAKDGAIADDVRKRRQPIVGKGEGVFSFIHVEDAASATIAAMEGTARGVYNVVDDDPAPMRDFMPVFAEAVGAKRPFRVPVWLARLGAPKVLIDMATTLRGATNERFKRDFGWQPRYASWREGFRGGLG